MQDVGCAAVALIFFGALSILAIKALRNRDRQAAQTKWRRGENITVLFEQYGTAAWPSAATTLASLLQAEPVGFVADLAGPHGWFSRVTPTLASLITSESDVADRSSRCALVAAAAVPP